MSVDLLRKAASEMRRDGCNGQADDGAFLDALAYWLENEALVIEDLMSGTHTTAIYANPAFGVAEAYLDDRGAGQ